MAQAEILTYSGIAATGTKNAVGAAGGQPFATYGLQVAIPSGSITSWTVTLDGSLDGVNWTTLITHNATIGSTSWETTGKPCTSVRVNVSALSLNTAPSITVTAIAVP